MSRATMVWGSEGSNIDVGDFHDLNEKLAELHDSYDAALSEWKDANESYLELRFEYLDTHDSVYRDIRGSSDKITLIKQDVATDSRVRSKEKMMFMAEGVKDHAERVMKKIESQRSMIQSRVKMILSQHQYDRTGPD